MVRSSVVSAVSSACEIRLVPDWRCFWSTNSKRSSSRKAPGSLATPWVDQLVLSTQKAEPQDACAAPAESRSARLPEHAIVNLLITFFSSSDLQPRAGSEAERAQLQPYLLEQRKSGEVRRGARRRARVERGVKLRLGERLVDLPGGGHRTHKDARRARNRGAALGVEGAQVAMGGPDAFAGSFAG